MTAAPSILFRFISAESSKAHDDKHDTARITRDASGAYELTYRYDSGVSNTMTMSDASVFRWVRNTLRLIEADADPVKEIQIDFPMMPSVMILTKNIGSEYHTVLDALEWHLDHWPAATPTPRPLFYPEETIPVDPDTAMSIDSPPMTPVRGPYNFRPEPTGRRHLFFDSNEERE